MRVNRLFICALALLCCAAVVYGHMLEESEEPTEYACIHDQILASARSRKRGYMLPSAVQTYPDYDFPLANNTKPIRIKLDLRYMYNDNQYTCYYAGQKVAETDNDSNTILNCSQSDVLSNSSATYLLNTLLPEATARLAELFQVVPVIGNLQVNPGECMKAGVEIPSEYYTNGVPDTDLLVFVTTRPIPPVTGYAPVLAYAVSCMDDQHHRSIVGTINIAPSTISTEIGQILNQVATIKHELTHVLGLSSSKYGNFRTRANTSPTGTDTTYSAVITVGGRMFINTSEVLNYVQNYYGCYTAVGALLEDGGSLYATAGSHWEKSMTMNEYMTGMTVRDPVMSVQTLAFFKDSGWYWTNYDAADEATWGYGLGCDFLAGCPSGWPTGSGYSCSLSSNAGDCTFDMTGKGSCGVDSLTGPNCPYIRGYGSAWCIDPTETGVTFPFYNNGEEYSPQSRCYHSTLVKRSPAGTEDMLICYKTACASETSLRVMVDDFWYTCPQGKTTAVKDYGGVITCPDPLRVCLGQPDQTTLWPQLTWISPDSGTPGTIITITGKYFTNVTSVYIAGDCTDLQVVDDNTLIVTLPTYDNIQNPSNFLTQSANVYITNNLGHNSFDWKRFTLKISLSKALLKAILKWLARHWYVPVIIGLIICALVLACWCCHRDSIKVREKRFQKQQRWEMHQIEEKQKPAASAESSTISYSPKQQPKTIE